MALKDLIASLKFPSLRDAAIDLYAILTSAPDTISVRVLFFPIDPLLSLSNRFLLLIVLFSPIPPRSRPSALWPTP